MMPMNSMSVDNMQGSTSGFSPMMGVSNSNAGVSSTMGRQQSKENNTSSSILAQAWKDDIDAGQLLPPVFELFGESLLSFIPKPESFIFL
jgi:transcription initiation factor TFIID subunit 6